MEILLESTPKNDPVDKPLIATPKPPDKYRNYRIGNEQAGIIVMLPLPAPYVVG